MTDPQTEASTEASAAATTSIGNLGTPLPQGDQALDDAHGGPTVDAEAANKQAGGVATPPADAATLPVDPAFERRAFVRRMGGDAVRTAGTVFSMSRILSRSAVAAGQAAMSELQSLGAGGVAGNADAPPVEAAVMTTPDELPSPAPTGSAPMAAVPPAFAVEPERVASPSPGLRPALLLDADQRALLEGATTAVVAVNREGHPPQLTTAEVLWDGQTVRFATLGWSRRTTMLRSDPRISLLIERPGDGRFVTVVGRALIFEGRTVRDVAWPLMLRAAADAGESAAGARWEELVAADADRAVIVVEPDQVLSGRR